MPQYYFNCEECGDAKRRLFKNEQEARATPIICDTCGIYMVRLVKAPTTQTTETLDNGVMVRKLERPANAEEIYEERAKGKKGVI